MPTLIQKSNNKYGTVTGSPYKIFKTYERMGYDAERAKDFRDMHYFFQHAYHWSKI